MTITNHIYPQLFPERRMSTTLPTPFLFPFVLPLLSCFLPTSTAKGLCDFGEGVLTCNVWITATSLAR